MSISFYCRIFLLPGMSDLSKKISLTRAISSMRRLFPDEYTFYPSSWFIPAQLDAFIKYCNRCEKSEDNSASFRNNNWFIVKPDDGGQTFNSFKFHFFHSHLLFSKISPISHTSKSCSNIKRILTN